MAIQVQANRVEKQLQMIFHIDLVPNSSSPRANSEGDTLNTSSEGVGSAKDESDEKYSNTQRIILLDGRCLQNVKVLRS